MQSCIMGNQICVCVCVCELCVVFKKVWFSLFFFFFFFFPPLPAATVVVIDATVNAAPLSSPGCFKLFILGTKINRIMSNDDDVYKNDKQRLLICSCIYMTFRNLLFSSITNKLFFLSFFLFVFTSSALYSVSVYSINYFVILRQLRREGVLLSYIIKFDLLTNYKKKKKKRVRFDITY